MVTYYQNIAGVSGVMWRSSKKRFVGNVKPCKPFSVAVALLFFCLILANTVPCFALNANYLDESKWVADSKTTTLLLDGKTSVNNTLDGVFKYYVDNENYCLYMYFSITESSITESNNLVKISATVNTSAYEYKFSIDENGICDSLSEEENIFTVQQNFSTTSNGGIFIAGFQFSNKSQSTVDIDLYINSHKYSIIDGIIMEPVATTTTAKSKKSSSTKSSKTTKKATAKSNNAKVSTTQTTKFSGVAETTSAIAKSSAATNQSENDTSTSESDINDSETVQMTQSKAKLSPTAKVLLITSATICAAGLIFLLLALIAKFKEKQYEKENKE